MKSILKNRFILVFMAFAAILFMSSCKKVQTCAEGYTGDACENQITPQNVGIKSFSLENLSTPASRKFYVLIREYGTGIEIWDKLYDASSSILIEREPSLSVDGSVGKINVFIYDSNSTTKKLLYSGICAVYDSKDGFPKYKTANLGSVKFSLNIEKYYF